MQLLTAEQVAETLQVSKLRVYEMARLGIIPCVRMGRQIRFDEKALYEWISQGGSANPNAGDIRFLEAKITGYGSYGQNKITGGKNSEK